MQSAEAQRLVKHSILMSDDALFTLLEDCADLLERKKVVSNLLAAGFWQLALARKTGAIKTDPENIRLEIEPSSQVRQIVMGEEASDFELFNSIRSSADGDDSVFVDPIHLFTAMPSPNLKESKANFTKSLEVIVQCANITKKINIALIHTSTS